MRANGVSEYKTKMLINADCLHAMDFIQTESIDLVLTDPPYGTTQCKWDSIIPLELMWEQLKRVIKPNGAIVITASQPFTTTLISSNRGMFRHEWIYQKRCASNFAQAKYAPMKEHENVVVFGCNSPKYYPIKEERKGSGKQRIKYSFTHTVSGDAMGNLITTCNSQGQVLRYPSTIQSFNNRAKGDRGLHPTQKPVALMEYMIKTYTIEGETVLDFAMGSGTTGVACKNLNREFIGIEKDRGYFEVAKERIAATN